MGAVVWGCTPLRTVVFVLTTAGWATEMSVGLGMNVVAVAVFVPGTNTGVGELTNV